MNRKRIRPSKTLATALGMLALLGLGIYLHQAGYIGSSQLSSALLELGCWGVPAFLFCFVIGGLVQIPGVIFVIAARLAFGPTIGFVLGYAGAVLAITAGFCMVRALRGDTEPSPTLKLAWAQRMLEKAEARPVATIATLRLVLFLSPPLNVGLGFSSVRFRHYVVGSAIGIIIPTALVTVATGLF